MRDRQDGERGFDHVEAWVFDLDNTLYPADCNLFAQIDRRMGEFIAEGVEGVVIINGKVPHAVLLELFTEHGAGTLIERRRRRSPAGEPK